MRLDAWFALMIDRAQPQIGFQVLEGGQGNTRFRSSRLRGPALAAGYLKGRHSCHKPQPKALLNAWLWRLWRAKHMAHQ
jgi:hypothetical protein